MTDTRNNGDTTAGRDAAGRFMAGNPGTPTRRTSQGHTGGSGVSRREGESEAAFIARAEKAASTKAQRGDI